MGETDHNAYQAILTAPGFSIAIQCNADEITGIEYLQRCPAKPPRLPLAHEAARQIKAYLQDPAFKFALPLAPAGTHFQRRVWDAIAAIPCGQTLSYGEVAAQIRSGPRAVGGACGANPYPIVVPCHRVLAANRALGGFGRAGGHWLLEIKRFLLIHENAHV
jgi:methylated-DNA-[protein]-cysteine S-methyltransferase